jgi:opacity protein-like surface antigen
MKLKTALLAAILVVVSAGAAPAANRTWFGPTAGFSLPMGDFGDVSNTGFHVGITGDYPLSGGFSVGGDIVWHRFTGKDSYEKGLSVLYSSPTDVSSDVWPITVHGKYALPFGGERYKPFVKAGLGLYHVGTKVDAGSAGSSDASDNNFGLNLGGGATFGNSEKLVLGVEAALHIISSEGSSTNLLTLAGTAMFGMGGK